MGLPNIFRVYMKQFEENDKVMTGAVVYFL